MPVKANSFKTVFFNNITSLTQKKKNITQTLHLNTSVIQHYQQPRKEARVRLDKTML